MKFDYAYDLLYDIKDEDELQALVDHLLNQLAGIAALRRRDGKPIDAYVVQVLDFPKE